MIVKLTSENCWLLENQKLYTDAQRDFAIRSPHLMYVVPRRKKFSRAQRSEIFEKSSGRCFHCNDKISRSGFHIDHLFPISAGGTDDPVNLAASCPACNLSKGAS